MTAGQANNVPETLTTSSTPEQEKDARVIPTVPKYLARGLDLKRWWDEVERKGGPENQFPLERSFSRPTRSFGFYGNAPVDNGNMPVMGNVQEMFYDQTRAPDSLNRESAEWMKSQLREFVMKYFMRISSFRQPEAYVNSAISIPPPAFQFLSWCPNPTAREAGFGFSQLFHKPIGAGQIYQIPTYQKHAIVDQREIGSTLEWIVLKVRIFDFTLRTRPLGTHGPEFVFGENEESYLVVNQDFVDFKDQPFKTDNGRTVLGEYGIGYSFVKSPTAGTFGYGPGAFDAAIELIKFRIYDTGYVSVRMIFVANRVHQVLNFVLDPVDWSFRLADTMTLGLASPFLQPVRDLLARLPLRCTVDPVSAYISLADGISSGYASEQFCISMETLEVLFLLKHFQQHYEAVLGSLLTWRLVEDWLNPDKLPPWVVTGVTV